jgi:23S rRNA (cytosine1962-C5)-methyltransferase
MARGNLRLNYLSESKVEWLCVDVFQQLRRFRDQGRTFDTIVLDPPKFAPTAAHAAKASRGYKDINLFALKLLRPGGTLLTFSCSGGISLDLFRKIVAGAALDAGVSPRQIAQMAQGPDHPVLLDFPEGAYLKGLILRR